MNQASLYQRANNVQRHDAEDIIKEFAGSMQWRPDGCDSLLDIGTGSGNVLMDLIYPIMPKNFELLVGSDISAKMIDYASKVYGSYERTKFRILDIGCEKIPNDLCEQFDHITSFYCLHWVQNQRTALRNIYKLLRPNSGDCLLAFLATNPIFDVYKTLSQTQKWGDYMKDVDNFISPLHFSDDPFSEFREILQDAGFTTHYVEIRSQIYVYEGLQNLKNNVMAICPFLERMPTAQHDDFLNDFVDVVDSMRLREHDETIDDYKFITPYKLVVAYATKSVGFISKTIDNDRAIRGLN